MTVSPTAYLYVPTDLLIGDRSVVLQREAVRPQRVHNLVDPSARLDGHVPVRRVNMQHLVALRERHHRVFTAPPFARR